MKVFRTGARNRVVAISGGAEGTTREWSDLDDEAAAALALDLMSDSDGWKNMINTS